MECSAKWGTTKQVMPSSSPAPSSSGHAFSARPCPSDSPQHSSHRGQPRPVLPATGATGLSLGFSHNRHGPAERGHILSTVIKVIFGSICNFWFHFSVCLDFEWEEDLQRTHIKLDYRNIRLEIRRPVRKLWCVHVKTRTVVGREKTLRAERCQGGGLCHRRGRNKARDLVSS